MSKYETAIDKLKSDSQQVPHILRNKNITIEIDFPEEGYKFSRFDWTGKVSRVFFRDIVVSGQERPDDSEPNLFGRGFYNEFGIDSALGFEEAENGGWFHKIGIGLLKKNTPHYQFHKKYEIRPARFDWKVNAEKLRITCSSDSLHGFSYVLVKEISLNEDGFSIDYRLSNAGEKRINTQEYAHNFMATDDKLMGPDYLLKFPFEVKPKVFAETINPEGLVDIDTRSITFKGTPTEQFFFSNLSGSEEVKAQWELTHKPSQLGIRETGSFNTRKINLWGWRHVISPELFVELSIDPGQFAEWSRNYQVFSTDG